MARLGAGEGTASEVEAVLDDATIAGAAEAVSTSPPPPVVTPVATVERLPTALEKECDPEDLRKIRAHCGSYSDTIINTLLAFDGYFTTHWYV